jgi:hypothetical protein
MCCMGVACDASALSWLCATDRLGPARMVTLPFDQGLVT